MKSFLIRIIVFFALVMIVIITPAVIVYLNLPVNPANGLAATINKNERLENTAGKRIILVGGSGVGMGFNSQMIRDSFPGYDVVNMGLFGQIGLCYMLNEVKGKLHEGDIVVVIPEYQHFFYQYYGDLGMMRAVKINPEGAANLTHWRQWLVIAERFGPHLAEQFSKNMENPDSVPRMWNRNAVNQYGDFCGHHYQPDEVDACTLPLFTSGTEEIEQGAIDGLNNFTVYCREHNASAAFMYPTIPGCTFAKNREAILRIDSAYSASCLMPRANTPETAVLFDGYFFDTVYHLTKDGADVRTQQFIRALRGWMYAPKR